MHASRLQPRLTHADEHFCDVCSKGCSAVWQCTRCDYDRCKSCHASMSTGQIPSDKAADKPPALCFTHNSEQQGDAQTVGTGTVCWSGDGRASSASASLAAAAPVAAESSGGGSTSGQSFRFQLFQSEDHDGDGCMTSADDATDSAAADAADRALYLSQASQFQPSLEESAPQPPNILGYYAVRQLVEGGSDHVGSPTSKRGREVVLIASGNDAQGRLLVTVRITVWKKNDGSVVDTDGSSTDNVKNASNPDSNPYTHLLTALRFIPVASRKKKIEIQALYNLLRESMSNWTAARGFNALAAGKEPGLQLPLRPYQRRAVRWMLEREFQEPSTTGDDVAAPLDAAPAAAGAAPIAAASSGASVAQAERGSVHPLWMQVAGVGGKVYYVHRYTHEITEQRFAPPLPVLGGILAEEMGLGKTVEVIACILQNPRLDLPPDAATPTQKEGKGAAAEDAGSAGAPPHAASVIMDPVGVPALPMSGVKPETAGTSVVHAMYGVKHETAMQTEADPSLSKDDSEAEGGPPEIGDKVNYLNGMKLLEQLQADKEAKMKPARKLYPWEQELPQDEAVTNALMEDLMCFCGGGTHGSRVGSRGDSKARLKTSSAQYSSKKKKHGATAAEKVILRCTESGCACAQHPACTKYTGKSDEFVCSSCTVKGKPVPSKTTLIICPEILKAQWKSEFEKHVEPGKLSVMVYTGIAGGGYIRPKDLAKYDVVITSYEILRAELTHAQAGSVSRASRNSKKYAPVPCSLVGVEWWRICLDEAQMVESSTSKTAAMAGMLWATNRWCVSGTPVSRGVDDLKGLAMFLRLDPYASDVWWPHAVTDGTTAVAPTRDDQHPNNAGGKAADLQLTHLEEAFTELIWRHSKEDVQDELKLPPQHAQTKKLRLDPVGRYFYNRLHEECKQLALTTIEKYCGGDAGDRTLSSLDSQTSRRVLAPLLRLRQACCHPSMAKGKVIGSSASGTTKSVRSMDDVMKQMISKAKVECTNAFRAFGLAMNALSALDLLESNVEDAVERYRTFVAMSDEYSMMHKVDRMQLLHALKNLKECLENEANTDEDIFSNPEQSRNAMRVARESIKHGATGDDWNQGIVGTKLLAAGVSFLAKYFSSDSCNHPCLLPDPLDASAPPTCSDACSEVAILTRRVESERQIELRNANSLVVLNLTAYERHARSLDFDSDGWVTEVIMRMAAAGSGMQLVAAVQDNAPTNGKLTEQFGDLHGLSMVIHRELTALRKAREQIVKLMSTLHAQPDAAEVAKLANCPVCRTLFADRQECPSKSKGKPCAFCDATDLFIVYEPLLFSHSTITKGEFAAASHPEPEGMDEEEDADATHPAAVGGGGGSSTKKKKLNDLQGEYFYLKKNSSVTNVTQQGPSELERLLRSLASEYKRSAAGPSVDPDLNEGISHFFAHLLGLKKEFYQIRILWKALYERVSTLDELAMCAQRIQRKEVGQVVSEAEKYGFVEDWEIPGKRDGYEHDLVEESHHLMKCRGRLTYLTAVQKRSKQPDSKVDCPVCFDNISKSLHAVLVCGHEFCLTCVEKIGKTGARNKVVCSLCKTESRATDVEYINTAPAADESHDVVDAIQVKGDLSAKVKAATKRLLQIRKDDDAAKTIVFSQWTPILDLIHDACSQNELPTIKLYGNSRKKQQTMLSTFKTDPKSTVLLLPTSSGSNGLNLTEATNVVVVEPLLNPAIELQALGRVHRIGQQKETHVYHLLIEETVEENVLEQQSILREIQKADAPSSPRKEAVQRANKGGKMNESGAMTIDELRQLFQNSGTRRHLKKDLSECSGASGGGAGKASADPECDASSATNAEFWSRMVIRRDRAVSRDAAKRNIEVAKSYGRSEGLFDRGDGEMFPLVRAPLSPSLTPLRLPKTRRHCYARQLASRRAGIPQQYHLCAVPLIQFSC